MAEGSGPGVGRYTALPPTLPPRALSREAAAAYIGLGVTKFDQLVADGRMPAPKRIDARKVWDRHALDSAFDELPVEAPPNAWDEAE